ncbi:AAA family ATPase (plasmid) [Burkholderia sp. FERM BP-3421]|uniref:AAA family ATPase n=1 Tax=Burkholderia sp. FERM BP-3421 TaxID=1494466 RepID=UPI00235F2503|nr:AAA family ATPase [Burkholderia sp. FERM BP-3421]WDD90364.1 AAA family ATPase [Burkholderia sp. FERM BP-3421]
MNTVLSTQKERAALTPSQEKTLNTLLRITPLLPAIVLQGAAGSGKTRVLKQLAADLDARFLPLGEVLNRFNRQDHPLRGEETLREVLGVALLDADVLVVDDIEVMTAFSRNAYASPRVGYIAAMLTELVDEAVARGKHVILSLTSEMGESTWFDEVGLLGQLKLGNGRAVLVSLPNHTDDDYGAILANTLGHALASRIDVVALHAFASRLSGNQLVAAARLALAAHPESLTTDDVVAQLQEYLESNLDDGQVEAVMPADLSGTEALWQVLDTHVLLPMRGGELVQSLGLKPTRGVLLYGKPGTGKTSIGRALAHRMKGKFFMIDGSIITEPPNAFFSKVTRIFEAAEISNPSIIFIDDADVLFGTSHVYGLNRYLLSKLDGLVSGAVGNVCLMMTAMNVNDLPPALVRSGRIELWLETKLPDREVRAEILARYSAVFPEPPTEAELVGLAGQSKGFTPADLRRIVGDAKALLVQDAHVGNARLPSIAYLSRALDLFRTMRGKANAALGSPADTVDEEEDDSAVNSCCG